MMLTTVNALLLWS